jgi:hypothetical protein
MAELNTASIAVEVTNDELKRQLGVHVNAQLVKDKAVNAKDEYIAALSESIANMKIVLDLVLTGKDAAQTIIHRPVLVDGDPLMNSNKTVVIYSMRTMSQHVDRDKAIVDKIQTTQLSAINEDHLQANKTDMLTAVDAFEKATQTIKEKLRLLEGDKNMQGKEIITLKDTLATERKV